MVWHGVTTKKMDRETERERQGGRRETERQRDGWVDREREGGGRRAINRKKEQCCIICGLMLVNCQVQSAHLKILLDLLLLNVVSTTPSAKCGCICNAHSTKAREAAFVCVSVCLCVCVSVCLCVCVCVCVCVCASLSTSRPLSLSLSLSLSLDLRACYQRTGTNVCTSAGERFKLWQRHLHAVRAQHGAGALAQHLRGREQLDHTRLCISNRASKCRQPKPSQHQPQQQHSRNMSHAEQK